MSGSIVKERAALGTHGSKPPNYKVHAMVFHVNGHNLRLCSSDGNVPTTVATLNQLVQNDTSEISFKVATLA